jgi:hypothetical protein
MVSLIEESSPPSPSRIMCLDVRVLFPATRNKGDRSAVAKISIGFFVLADVEI